MQLPAPTQPILGDRIDVFRGHEMKRTIFNRTIENSNIQLIIPRLLRKELNFVRSVTSIYQVRLHTISVLVPQIDDYRIATFRLGRPVVVEGHDGRCSLQVCRAAPDGRRAQRRVCGTGTNSPELPNGLLYVAGRRIMLVLVLQESILPGFHDCIQRVQLLIEVADPVGDVSHLHLVLEAIALDLHFLLLGLDDGQLIGQYLFLPILQLLDRLNELPPSLLQDGRYLLDGPVDGAHRFFGSRIQLRDFIVDVFGRLVQLGDAEVSLVQQDLRHALDGDREWYDSVLARATLSAIPVRPGRAQAAEHAVARLTEQQLLGGMQGALGDHLGKKKELI